MYISYVTINCSSYNFAMVVMQWQHNITLLIIPINEQQIKVVEKSEHFSWENERVRKCRTTAKNVQRVGVTLHYYELISFLPITSYFTYLANVLKTKLLVHKVSILNLGLI